MFRLSHEFWNARSNLSNDFYEKRCRSTGNDYYETDMTYVSSL